MSSDSSTNAPVTRQLLVNGQQTSALLQAMKSNMESVQPSNVLVQNQNPQTEQNKQFVLTPDYIQQSMFIYQPSVIVLNPNCPYPLQNDIITHY